jgi:hypothetical protein
LVVLIAHAPPSSGGGVTVVPALLLLDVVVVALLDVVVDVRLEVVLEAVFAPASVTGPPLVLEDADPPEELGALPDPLLVVGLPPVPEDVDPPEEPRPMVLLELPGCGLPASSGVVIADVPHARAPATDSAIERMCGRR